jgi:UDP-glucose 4-epimerase
MKVLLTGASGHLGGPVLHELLRQGHIVRCMVRRKRDGRRLARQGKAGQVEIALGDIRDAGAVQAAVDGQEVVIHLAAVLPPVSDQQPDLARAVNVGGTQQLIAAMQAQPQPPKLLYISTIALFGNTQALPPPRRVGDPIAPMDPYSKHKAECETLVASSGLTWAILRLTAVPRFFEGFDPLRLRAMFAVPLTDRIEMIHPYDAALALANAVKSQDVWGKTLIIAGGPRCRILMRDYDQGYLEGAGIGMLPANRFTTTSYHLDWYDTDESQALLHYQRYSSEEFFQAFRRNMTLLRWAATAFRPLVRRIILHYAPPPDHQDARHTHAGQERS